jgi:nucleotide-binding universal stress UspA family protein
MTDDPAVPDLIDDEEEPLAIPEIDASIGSVLVPVDGSPGSEIGMAWADLIARTVDAEVIVVVAFNPPSAIRRRGILETEHLRIEMEADAKEVATEAAQLFLDRGRRARALVVVGDAAEAILETAEAEQVGLIVMGRRGLGRLQGLLVGSVSERVARLASVPVFLAS